MADQNSSRDTRDFIGNHASRIIEGCYSDIIEALLVDCEELILLNTGVITSRFWGKARTQRA
ncbi:hypothetical protein [Marinobacter qingdaonensis]|uniref:Uncharacterized protein n=1 Tax=Marinobacter qingdaonensis TaxID=3108486 RepID=A0ABU5NU26_9GAMM|nr:hypothetical protein [Marinobacter sp. ASW11-75]MEA1079310.1 hypothetical protein [Marinobacter sp. ASW11-75]MEE3118288.1 hypothetical protein [Pseudomonadota bacterium]